MIDKLYQLSKIFEMQITSNTPFYSNYSNGGSCTVAVFRMLIEKLLGEKLSYDGVKSIGSYIPEKVSWTIPYHVYLAKKGVTIKNITF